MNLRVRPRVKHDYEEEILSACLTSVILVGKHAGQPSLSDYVFSRRCRGGGNKLSKC